MKKTILLLSSALILSGCADKQRAASAIDELSANCKSELSITMTLSAWGNKMTVECYDVDKEWSHGNTSDD